MRPATLFALAIAISAAAAGRAAAQELSPITNRNYAIDLYQGAALGSVRIVGMGGASVALATGSAGMAANPAAPAVRPATSTGTWDWDWHLDYLSPELGSDFDNDGIRSTQTSIAPLLTLGVTGIYREWALGLSATQIQHRVDIPTEPNAELSPDASLVRLGLARSFAGESVVAGVAIRTGEFTVDYSAGGSQNTLFRILGSALELGALWQPRERNFRVGGAFSLPVSSDEVTVKGCDPLNCHGYILPDRVAVPWRLSVGAAWRRGPTPWNRKIHAHWRDERYLLLAADLLLTGAVDGGSGIGAFAQDQLEPSGRHLDLSARLGAEYEWLPGRLRVRGGTYWEPSRFEGVSGRLHVTVGLDVRVISLTLWGDPYRIRLSLTADGASHYANTGLSIGFWH